MEIYTLMTNAKCFKMITVLLFLIIFTSETLAKDPAGKTMLTRGDVKAISSEEALQRLLKRRSVIFTDDKVITGQESRTQLRMTDGSMIAIKENTELIIDEYKFNIENEPDSVVLNLVQGGLRSITGAIKAEKGQYKLKTPIGSIGIRGTHYEVVIMGDIVWIGVWDGAIDVTLTSGEGELLSLGAGENYSYASIDSSGFITRYLEPPKVLERGLSSNIPKQVVIPLSDNTPKVDVVAQKPKGETTDTQNPKGDDSDVQGSKGKDAYAQNPKDEDTDDQEPKGEGTYAQIPNDDAFAPPKPTDVGNDVALIITSIDEGSTEFINNDVLNSLQPQNVFDLVTERQGTIEYADADVSSDFNLTNFTASMAINFDSGLISNGTLSFNDDRSTDPWNAVFNGNMRLSNEQVNLDVDITFASHGDKLADGDISAGFIDVLGLDAISGAFELYEIDEDVRVDGSYTLKNSERP